MRKSHWMWGVTVATALVMSGTVEAQSRRDGAEGEPAKKGMPDGKPGKPLLNILDEVEKAINKEIDLEKDQREEIDELFDDTRTRLEEESKQSANLNQENSEKVADLREQMQKAREDKDWATFRELAKQMRELTQGGQANPGEVLRELHESLKEILDKDQQEKLDEIINRHKGEFEHRFQDGMFKLMAMLQATEQLDMDEEQVAELKDFKAAFMRDMKDMDKSDTAAMDRMYSERREDLLKILHDDQIKAFEKAEAKTLENMKSHKASRMGEPGKHAPEDKSDKKSKKASPTKSKNDEGDGNDEDEEDSDEDSE